MAKRLLTRCTWVALATASLLAGCSGPSDESHIGSARTALEAGDANTATIHLKSVLERTPQSREARALLARTLLLQGNPRDAELEFEKALAAGATLESVAPGLAEALLGQAKFAQVIERFGAGGTASDPDLMASVALARYAQGEREAAHALLAQAIQAHPKADRALAIASRLAWAEQRVEAAADLARRSLEANPANAQALHVLAQRAAAVDGDIEAARGYFTRSVTADPRFAPGHIGLVMIDLAQGRMEAAQRSLAAMAVHLPASPQTAYLGGLLALNAGEVTKAREISQKLLGVAPNEPRLLELAGRAEAAAGSLVQAEIYLRRALTAAPGTESVTLALAGVYLRAGQTGNALTLLRPLVSAPQVSPNAHVAMAQALVLSGDLQGAEQQFRRALAKRPDDTRLQGTLAMMAVQRGEAGALDTLNEIAMGQSDGGAVLALASARLRAGDTEAALKALQDHAARHPGQVIAPHLSGQIRLRQKDLDGARRDFARAVEIDPAHFPSVQALAELDLRQGKAADALARYRDLLRLDPRNTRAALSIAETHLRSGAPAATVVAALEQAVSIAPAEPGPRVALVNYLLTQPDRKAPLAAAQAAAAAISGSADVQEVLGLAQAAAGETQQALTTFNRMVTAFPDSIRGHLRLADLHASLRARDASIDALRRALTVQPQALEVQATLIGQLSAAGRHGEAQAVARTVQQQRPKEGAGFYLQGDIESARGNWAAAAASYREALQREPQATVAIKLHRTLLAAGSAPAAEQFATQWRRQAPEDLQFAHHLAAVALREKAFGRAQALLEDVLAQAPGDFRAMNNLAWAAAEQGQADRALQWAERAVAVAPANPAVLDTLARALAAQGQLDRALEAQLKAQTAAPQDPELRLNLARLYIQRGDRDQARTELATLQRLGGRFSRQAEVETLLRSL